MAEPEAPEPPPTPDMVREGAEWAERRETEIMERDIDPSRRFDRLHRREPRRLGFLQVVRAVPQLAERIRKVPRSAVVEEREQEGEEEVLLKCPCGTQPTVPRLSPTKCGGCERWYFWSQNVWVVYGQMEPPAPPVKAPA